MTGPFAIYLSIGMGLAIASLLEVARETSEDFPPRLVPMAPLVFAVLFVVLFWPMGFFVRRG